MVFSFFLSQLPGYPKETAIGRVQKATLVLPALLNVDAHIEDPKDQDEPISLTSYERSFNTQSPLESQPAFPQLTCDKAKTLVLLSP